MGRPTSYTPEIADRICAEMAEGKSLRTVCRADDLPHISTVFRWLATQAEFREQYARAREMQADALFEDVLEIADDARNDWMEDNAGDNAAWKANGEHIQRSKLRIDARKWMAGKLRPKSYGDKQEVEHTGKVAHHVLIVPAKEPDDTIVRPIPKAED